MKKIVTTIKITLLMCCLWLPASSMYGQNGVDASVYIAGDAFVNPDFEASLPEIEWTRDALLRDLPSAVDNSTLLEGYMPPIFHQFYSHSCVHCAEIGYVFTYELNRFNEKSSGSEWYGGSEAEMQNLYHPFYTYNFVNG